VLWYGKETPFDLGSGRAECKSISANLHRIRTWLDTAIQHNPETQSDAELPQNDAPS